MLSSQADKEPTLQVNIEGKSVTLMIDTGAIYSCVTTADAQHLPRSKSGRVAKTIGFSGQVQLIPFSAPVTVELDGKQIKMPILMSDHTPINLMGRDILSRMGVQIECTPNGLSLISQEPCHAMASQIPISKTIYWIRLLQVGWDENIWKWWKPLIHANYPLLRDPRCPAHCTIMMEDTPSGEKQEEWKKVVSPKNPLEMRAQYVIIGPEGMGVQVELKESALTRMYNIPDSVPHITLKVGLGFRARHVGSMMKRAQQVEWMQPQTINDNRVKLSKDKTLTRLDFTCRITGLPQIVDIQDDIRGPEVGVSEQLQPHQAY